MVDQVHPNNFAERYELKFLPLSLSLSFSLPKKAKKLENKTKSNSESNLPFSSPLPNPTNGEDAQSSEQHVLRRFSATLSRSHVITSSSSSQAQRLRRFSTRRVSSASERRRTGRRTALGSRNGEHGKSRE